MPKIPATSSDTGSSPAAVPEILPPVVSWSMDVRQGILQGPLDLAFLRDHTLSLDLTDSQVALVTREGRLSRLFLAGHHDLPVGTGPGYMSCSRQLIFLDLGQPFRFQWSRSDHLDWDGGSDRPLVGEAAVMIRAPRTFFATFLAGNLHLDPIFVERLVAQVVRASLGRAVAQAVPGAEELEFEALQNELQKLEADILDPYLEPCGLKSAELSIYTLSDRMRRNTAAALWPETAGHSLIMRHN